MLVGQPRPSGASAGDGGCRMSESTRPTRFRVGVFPGQFDPITNGHLDVIRRGRGAVRRTDRRRRNQPREAGDVHPRRARPDDPRRWSADMPGVRVEKYGGLTVDFVRQVQRDGDPPRHPRRVGPALRIPTRPGQPRGGRRRDRLHHDRRPVRPDQQQPDSPGRRPRRRRRGNSPASCRTWSSSGCAKSRKAPDSAPPSRTRPRRRRTSAPFTAVHRRMSGTRENGSGPERSNPGGVTSE